MCNVPSSSRGAAVEARIQHEMKVQHYEIGVGLDRDEAEAKAKNENISWVKKECSFCECSYLVPKGYVVSFELCPGCLDD